MSFWIRLGSRRLDIIDWMWDGGAESGYRIYCFLFLPHGLLPPSLPHSPLPCSTLPCSACSRDCAPWVPAGFRVWVTDIWGFLSPLSASCFDSYSAGVDLNRLSLLGRPHLLGFPHPQEWYRPPSCHQDSNFPFLLLTFLIVTPIFVNVPIIKFCWKLTAGKPYRFLVPWQTQVSLL